MLIHLNQAQQAYLLDLVRENLQALVDADGDFIEQSLLGASVMTALQRDLTPA